MKITMQALGALYFNVVAPCGTAWTGMRNTEDMRVLLERAIEHTDGCDRCKKAAG